MTTHCCTVNAFFRWEFFFGSQPKKRTYTQILHPLVFCSSQTVDRVEVSEFNEFVYTCIRWMVFFIAILSFHYKSFCLHFTVCLYVRCWYLLYWAFGTSITLMHLFLILLLYYNCNVVNLQIANAQP